MKVAFGISAVVAVSSPNATLKQCVRNRWNSHVIISISWRTITFSFVRPRWGTVERVTRVRNGLWRIADGSRDTNDESGRAAQCFAQFSFRLGKGPKGPAKGNSPASTIFVREDAGVQRSRWLLVQSESGFNASSTEDTPVGSIFLQDAVTERRTWNYENQVSWFPFDAVALCMLLSVFVRVQIFPLARNWIITQEFWKPMFLFDLLAGQRSRSRWEKTV